ncbi:hypothetical protein AAFF_G00021870 [Aldrovandia affinis]|uniref:Uncharacterized protein n=1 Tax=Aldrovandia affinis TaxID=143900 RepID=A0AAD7S559_9TELE|nr:hypothetical protein AAFF_G00021870 [Aldrovandia affinis]
MSLTPLLLDLVITCISHGLMKGRLLERLPQQSAEQIKVLNNRSFLYGTWCESGSKPKVPPSSPHKTQHLLPKFLTPETERRIVSIMKPTGPRQTLPSPH